MLFGQLLGALINKKIDQRRIKSSYVTFVRTISSEIFAAITFNWMALLLETLQFWLGPGADPNRRLYGLNLNVCGVNADCVRSSRVRIVRI
jgi:hypothetical protein